MYFRKPTLSFGFILDLKAWKDTSGFKCFCQHCACLHSEYAQQTGKTSPDKYQFISPCTGLWCAAKEWAWWDSLCHSSSHNPVTKSNFQDRLTEGQKGIIFATHTSLFFLFWQWPKHIFQHYLLSHRMSWLLLMLQSSSHDSSRKAETEKKNQDCWHLRYLDWNTSNCYFSQEKGLACILFAASVAVQKKQSNKIQHICKRGTAFNVSNELCTGCGSKSELGVIICSVSKKSVPNQELYFLFQRASYSTITAAYLSSSLSTALAPLHGFCFFLAFVILGFAISSWMKTPRIPNPNSLLSCYEQKKSECSVKELKKDIFTTFNSHLHRPHQINVLSTQSAKGWLWCREKHLLGSFVFHFLESICKKQHNRNNSSLNFSCLLHSQMSSPRGIWY